MFVALAFGWSNLHPVRRMIAVEDGPMFLVGVSETGIYERHSWTIRNEGTIPLKLRTHFTSGRSGFSLWLGQERFVEPGAKFVVSLTWRTPTHEACSFSNHAEVWTNDSEQPRIKFKVAGRTGPSR